MTARLFFSAAVAAALLPCRADAAAPPERAAPSSSPTSGYSIGPRASVVHHRSGVWQHHASTPAESFARGLASLIAARAEARLLTAQARIAAAEAADRELDNRKKAVQTGFELRQMNRRSRAAEQGPRASREDLARYARSGTPEPLSPSELAPATGELSWPMALLTARYADFRAAVDRFFARRAGGGLDPAESVELYQTAKAMLAELADDVRQLPPSDYIDARRFLESLAHTAGLPGP